MSMPCAQEIEIEKSGQAYHEAEIVAKLSVPLERPGVGYLVIEDLGRWIHSICGDDAPAFSQASFDGEQLVVLIGIKPAGGV